MLKRLLTLQFWVLLCAIALVSLRSLPEGINLPANDKWLHFAAYAGTALSARIAYPFFPTPLLAVGLFSFSIAIEAGQFLVPGRACDIGDVLANGLGIITGLLLWRLAALLRGMKTT